MLSPKSCNHSARECSSICTLRSAIMAGLASRFNRRLESSLILVVFERRNHFGGCNRAGNFADSVALCAMRFEVLLRMQGALEKTKQSNRIHHDRAVAETAQALTSRQNKPTSREKTNEGYPCFSPCRSGRHRRGRSARPFRISRARRAAVEEVCRHHDRGQPDQGTKRRVAAEIRVRVYRPDRYQGRIRSHSGAAAAAEGRHRTDFRQAEF